MVDGTALRNRDYIASSGTLSFAPGEVRKDIQRVTSILSNGHNPDFSKYPGRCDGCGRTVAWSDTQERRTWLELHWDVARRYDLKHYQGSKQTEFWIGETF